MKKIIFVILIIACMVISIHTVYGQAQSSIQQLEQMINNGNYVEALPSLQEQPQTYPVVVLIAKCYRDTEQYDDALVSYRKALALASTSQEKLKCSLNEGICLYELKRLEEAKKIFETYQYSKETNNLQKSIIYSHLGMIWDDEATKSTDMLSKKERRILAYQYHKKDESFSPELLQVTFNLVRIEGLVGYKKPLQAINEIEAMKKKFEKSKNYRFLKYCFIAIFEISSEHNLKTSGSYRLKADSARSTIEQMEKIINAEKRHGTKKAQESANNAWIAFLLLSLFFLPISFFLYITQKQHKKIKKQKQEIQIQRDYAYAAQQEAEEARDAETRVNQKLRSVNESLEGAIKAAFVLQSKILPSAELLSDCKMKVLFCPYQTLSGDAYHVQVLDDGRILGVVYDAEGHGPEGALSTIAIASNIQDVSLESASSFLSQLDTKLQAAFRDRSNTVACSVLLKDGDNMQISAAKQNVLWYQQRSGDVILLEGCRKALGTKKDVLFAQSDTTVESGDIFIVYSDGLTDCKVRGKKLGTKGLQDFIKKTLAEGKDIYHELQLLAGSADRPDDLTCLLWYM